jgi:hypothetical protein
MSSTASLRGTGPTYAASSSSTSELDELGRNAATTFPNASLPYHASFTRGLASAVGGVFVSFFDWQVIRLDSAPPWFPRLQGTLTGTGSGQKKCVDDAEIGLWQCVARTAWLRRVRVGFGRGSAAMVAMAMAIAACAVPAEWERRTSSSFPSLSSSLLLFSSPRR